MVLDWLAKCTETEECAVEGDRVDCLKTDNGVHRMMSIPITLTKLQRSVEYFRQVHTHTSNEHT